jgi:hypothetical protein
MLKVQNYTKQMSGGLWLPDEPTAVREPSRTSSAAVGELLSAQVDERGEAVSEPTAKSVARPLVDALDPELDATTTVAERSNPHHPERDGCEEGTMTVGDYLEPITCEAFREVVRKMRWTVGVDLRSHVVVVGEQKLRGGPEVYAELSVDDARALSLEIRDIPARATVLIGDDLSLSGEELAVFAFELYCGASLLTGVS